MLSVALVPMAYTNTTVGRRPSGVDPADAFARALCQAEKNGYVLTPRLEQALDSLVRRLRFSGQSTDDAIDEVECAVRRIAPNALAPSDVLWDDSWRAYFALYDTLIQRTVRTYVAG